MCPWKQDKYLIIHHQYYTPVCENHLEAWRNLPLYFPFSVSKLICWLWVGPLKCVIAFKYEKQQKRMRVAWIVYHLMIIIAEAFLQKLVYFECIDTDVLCTCTCWVNPHSSFHYNHKNPQTDFAICSGECCFVFSHLLHVQIVAAN